VRGGDRDPLVGVLGETADGHVFALYRLSACVQLQELGRAPVEFDYRTAPTPSFPATPYVAKTAGVKFAVDESMEGVVSFAHYDGYDVRIVRVRPSGDAPSEDAWDILEEKHAVHADRTDLSAPNR
jgi:hypothetical protein